MGTSIRESVKETHTEQHYFSPRSGVSRQDRTGTSWRASTLDNHRLTIRRCVTLTLALNWFSNPVTPGTQSDPRCTVRRRGRWRSGRTLSTFTMSAKCARVRVSALWISDATCRAKNVAETL